MEELNVDVEEVVEKVVEEVALDDVIDVAEEISAPAPVELKEVKKVKTFTSEKKVKERVPMPEKVNIDGKMVYTKESIFTKEQFAQMLADAGMDPRASVGQSSIFYKGETPDTKVLQRTGREIVRKYLTSRSIARDAILTQFEGISEEDIKENVKSKKLEDWIEPIRMALMLDPELDQMLQEGEDAGRTMRERVATSQKGKVAKLCNIPSEKKNEIPEETLAAHLKSMTSKYGMAAIFGVKYKSISPQEVISEIRKRK